MLVGTVHIRHDPQPHFNWKALALFSNLRHLGLQRCILHVMSCYQAWIHLFCYLSDIMSCIYPVPLFTVLFTPNSNHSMVPVYRVHLSHNQHIWRPRCYQSLAKMNMCRWHEVGFFFQAKFCNLHPREARIVGNKSKKKNNTPSSKMKHHKRQTWETGETQTEDQRQVAQIVETWESGWFSSSRRLLFPTLLLRCPWAPNPICSQGA